MTQFREPQAECVTASDGTEFAVFSEHVRGEPRFFCIKRRGTTEAVYRTDGGYDGSYDKRTIMRRLAKRVREWEQTL